VLIERPQVARLGAGLLRCRIECSLEVERLRSFAALADIQRSQQVRNLVLAEAREREVEVRRRLQVGQESSEELLVSRTRDLVEGEPEEPGLFQ